MTYKLRTVQLSKVIVEDRYREDMGNLEELIASIKEKGIIQPICITKDMRLLAGGRRHAACTSLGMDTIPAIIRDDETEVDEKEIELMENIHRKEMTWQEQARLISRIHTLYQEKNEDWGMRATANFINKSAMTISRAVRLATVLDNSPELIEDCEDASQAFARIKKLHSDVLIAEKRKEQQEFMNRELQFSSTSGMDGPQHPEDAKSQREKEIRQMLRIADKNYQVMDTFEGMGKMKENGPFNFIECDPPFGVSLNKTNRPDQPNGNIIYESYLEIPEDEYEAFLQKLAKETYRVAHRDCVMVFWFGMRYYDVVLKALSSAGWKVDSIPALWVKNTMQTPNPKYLLGRKYEQFFICRKGNAEIVKQGMPNIWTHPCETHKYHPAQRPVSLMESILEVFLTPGQGSVLIPFLGSGATLRACYNQGHLATGFDLSGEYKNRFMLNVEEDVKRLQES